MAVALAPLLVEHKVNVVVSDVITVAGGWAADLVGVRYLELSPHPLYLQSKGLPPIGAGMARGTDTLGRLRDRVLRASSASARARGRRQRADARRSIGLPGESEPIGRLVATLPGIELYRPDWPTNTHLIGPLLWEPTDETLAVPDGATPLVMVAPSTAATGTADLASLALSALSPAMLGMTVRVAISGMSTPTAAELRMSGIADAVAGFGRQDEIVERADIVVCGGGHGMLVKALGAGVPVVTVPGGGDQWELANRVQRLGAGKLVRPATPQTLADAVRDVCTDDSFRRAAADVAATSTVTVDPVRVIEATATGSPRVART